MWPWVFLFPVLLMAPAVVAQQAPAPLTHVAMFHVKPGKGADFINFTRKYNGPVLDRLKAEGTVLAWGVDTPVLHEAGGATHSIWWTVTSFEALQKFEDARAESMQKVPAAELLEVYGAIEMEKHVDFVFRQITGAAKSAPPGALPFTRVVRNRVAPGKGEEYRQLWEKYYKPVFERLLAEGTILHYSLQHEAMNTMEPEWRWTVVTLPSLAAHDRVFATFTAEEEKRSPQERSMFNGQMASATVAGARRDMLLRAVVFSGR